MLLWITITIPLNQPRIRYRGSPRNLRRGNNRGHSSWTKITAKVALVNTPLYSLVSMVRIILGSFLHVAQCTAGCAMIIARSFARIHETNLKVRISFFTILLTASMRRIVFRSRAFYPCGSLIRMTMAGLGLVRSWKPWELLICSQENRTELWV